MPVAAPIPRLPRRDPSEGIARAVEEFRPDLIHSHNLPDLLTVLALEAVGGDVPVIHDVHDMQSLRRTPYEDGFDDPEDPLALERAAVKGCDGLIAVSIEMLAELEARYDLAVPVLLFANYALERDLAPDAGARASSGGPPRVVYQGSLSDNGSHYDLRGHFAAIAGSGIPIDVFPNRDAPAYRALAARTPGMRVMGTLEPAALLQTGTSLAWTPTWTPSWPWRCACPWRRRGRVSRRRRRLRMSWGWSYGKMRECAMAFL